MLTWFRNNNPYVVDPVPKLASRLISELEHGKAFREETEMKWEQTNDVPVRKPDAKIAKAYGDVGSNRHRVEHELVNINQATKTGAQWTQEGVNSGKSEEDLLRDLLHMLRQDDSDAFVVKVTEAVRPELESEPLEAWSKRVEEKLEKISNKTERQLESNTAKVHKRATNDEIDEVDEANEANEANEAAAQLLQELATAIKNKGPNFGEEEFNKWLIRFYKHPLAKYYIPKVTSDLEQSAEAAKAYSDIESNHHGTKHKRATEEKADETVAALLAKLKNALKEEQANSRPAQHGKWLAEHYDPMKIYEPPKKNATILKLQLENKKARLEKLWAEGYEAEMRELAQLAKARSKIAANPPKERPKEPKRPERPRVGWPWIGLRPVRNPLWGIAKRASGTEQSNNTEQAHEAEQTKIREAQIKQEAAGYAKRLEAQFWMGLDFIDRDSKEFEKRIKEIASGDPSKTDVMSEEELKRLVGEREAFRENWEKKWTVLHNEMVGEVQDTITKVYSDIEQRRRDKINKERQRNENIQKAKETQARVLKEKKEREQAEKEKKKAEKERKKKCKKGKCEEEDDEKKKKKKKNKREEKDEEQERGEEYEKKKKVVEAKEKEAK